VGLDSCFGELSGTVSSHDLPQFVTTLLNFRGSGLEKMMPSLSTF
jgi:hypothetical protein